MDRMKTFGLYALCIILFFIFSNVMINIAVKSMYNSIDVDIALEENLKVDVSDIRATAVNGYVKGSVNNIGNLVSKTYVKIDLYSSRDVLLGTKYVEMDNLQKGDTREFDMEFKFDNVDHAKVCMVDKVENATEDSFKSDHMGGIAVIVAVIFLCYFA